MYCFDIIQTLPSVRLFYQNVHLRKEGLTAILTGVQIYNNNNNNNDNNDDNNDNDNCCGSERA